MKKIITTVMALTLALGMSVTAIAAPSPQPMAGASGALAGTGSATQEEVQAAEAALSADGAVKFSEVEKAVETSAGEATKELVKVNANEEARIFEVLDITVPDAVKAVLEKGGTVDLTFTLETKGTDNIKVLHQKKDGTWEVVPSRVEGMKIIATFSSLSPVAFVEIVGKTATSTPTTTPNNSGAAQTQSGVTSPKTGEAGVVGFALIAVACGAALVFTKKKFA